MGDVSVYKVGEKGRQSRTGAEHVCGSMTGQHGLPPFFPGGAFPEEPRIAVFHSYFHGRDPFIEGYNAALRNRF